MSATFRASAIWDAAGASSHNFTAQPIGTAATDRLVVVSVSAKGTAIALSSVTIGGVTATVHRSKANSAADYRAAVVSAVVPSGTTADVVVTFAAGINRAGIGVWTVNGGTATGQFAESADASAAALTVTTAVGDSVIAAVALEVTSQTGAGTAWTGATEDFDESIASLTRQSGANVDATGASTAITATQANYVRGAAVAVAFSLPAAPPINSPQYLRAEVAFTTSPDDPAPAFEDLTSRLDKAAGVSITRGRQDEYGAVTPGRCSLVLDNTDGELTAGRASSSRYPNVKPSRRMRVTYRDPNTSGNLLSATDSSFESGTVGGWLSGGAGGPILSNSTTRAVDGTKSLLVTWGAGAFPFAEVIPGGLVIGRTYIFSASAYVPAGSPAVRLAIDSTLIGTATTTTAAWERISGTFTATSANQRMQIWPTTSPTTGQQVWLDAVMLDEGTTLNTFTTTAPPIEYRYDGYVEEWPTEWPGGNKYTQARITAVDLLARLGTKRKLRSVVEETVLLPGPAAYYPLGEPEGSFTASDVTGSNSALLRIITAGAGGGTLTFGTGIGPGTDNLPAPQFTPSSASNGYYLRSDILSTSLGHFDPLTLRASFLYTPPGVPWANQTIVALADDYGFFIRLYVNGSDNKLYAQFYDAWASADTFLINSTTTFNDTQTHNVALTIDYVGNAAKLWEGSTQLATVSLGGRVALPTFTTLTVGGLSPGGFRTDAGLFTGTISHAAAYNVVATPTQLGDQRTAADNGFSGERSDQRIARIASWMGFPTARQVLDTGQSTSIAHVDPTGKKPLDYMQQITDTEGGVLFADRQGRLVFYSRSRAYTAQTVTAAVDAHDVSADVSPLESKQDLVNDMTGKRTDGGPEIRYIDAASIVEHGSYEDSLELAVTSDNEVLSAIQWRVNSHSQPSPRVPDVAIDAMTNAAIQAQVRAIDVWSRLQISSTPTQAHASTWDLLAQGYSEAISTSGWQVSVNSTAYSQIQGWRVDDAVYSQVDAGYQFVY